MTGAPRIFERMIHSVESIIFDKSNKSDGSQTAESTRYAATLKRVSDFLAIKQIEPTPDNYALAYRHIIKMEHGLTAAVEKMIETGSAQHDPIATQNGFGDEDLSLITEKALENLKAIELLIRTSTRDTKGFGDALHDSTGELSKANKTDPAIASLIDLTRVMIEKTKKAESELRVRSQAMSDLQTSLSEAQIKADTDALTGLSNRRAFDRALGAACLKATVTGEPMSLAICDIDHFKLINDTHGHETGDRVLQFVSSLMREICGKKRPVARFGGEEFVVIFEGMTSDQAHKLIDSMRAKISERKLVSKDSGLSIGGVTFSAGVSSLDKDGDISGLLRAADRAMYRAKANGRNCVMQA
jgi:diguanylate cyclase